MLAFPLQEIAKSLTFAPFYAMTQGNSATHSLVSTHITFKHVFAAHVSQETFTRHMASTTANAMILL